MGGVVAIVVGSVVASAAFAVALVLVILRVVDRMQRRALAPLEARGIERRSGHRTLTVRLDDYRSERVLASGMRSRRRGELVLTGDACVLVAAPYVIPLGGARMDDLEVADDGGALRLATERPPGATGRVEIRVPVDDLEGWKLALAARGARV